MAEVAAEQGKLSLNRDLVERISDTLDEPDYMREFRLEAYELYEELPIPSAKNSEEWRRTDVTDLEDADLKASSGKGFAEETLPRYLQEIRDNNADERSGVQLSHNAGDVYTEVGDELSDNDIVFCPMSEAVREYPDVVQDHFMTEALEVDLNKFSAMHAAFWTGGTFLYVPNNTEIELPVEIHNYIDRDGLSLFDHNLIVVGANSRINIVDSHTGSDELEERAVCANAVEIYVDDGAAVDYSHIQDLGNNYYDVSMRRGVCQNQSQLNWITGTLGGQKNKTNAITKLNGEGSETFLYGVMLASEDQHVDSDISTVHDAPYTTDEMLARGVVLDESKGIFRGVITMEKGSRKAKGSLHERVLMVGDDCEADAVPEMTINENDVKAAHSASVGELDQKQLLYMQSRGIDRERARRLIILGFFEPILDKLPVERVKQNLVDLIHRKLDEANV
ncbi:MAG: Fe-S cluster assembly protein SufD [bacterium]